METGGLGIVGGRVRLVDRRAGRLRAGRRPAAAVVLLLVLPALSALGGCEAPRKNTPKGRATQAEAEAATRAGDWKTAADRWHSIFLADPECPVRPCAETARALLRLKDAESAANLLDLGLAKHPGDPDLLERKGEALVQLGFRRAAEECFEKALAADPRRAGALLALGRLRVELGLESAAIVPLKRAIALTGGDFETWRLLAKAWRASGSPREAYEAWLQAFALGEGAVDDLVEAATLFVDESLRHAHPEAGEKMLVWLNRAVERDPQCTRAHFQLGVISEELGGHEEAIEHYRRAVEVDPGCLMALTNLAILYARRGDERNTREMVERALALEQDGMRRKALQRLLDPFGKRGEHGGPGGTR